MEKEKGKIKPYKVKPTEPSILKEPSVTYGIRYTYADYLTWLDDKRRELINGFIHLMSAPMYRHADVSSELCTLFRTFIKKKKGKCKAFHAPFDVRLPLHGSTEDGKIYDVVQPDVCVVCDMSKLDDKGCIGAPDLVVEVLSPSTMKYDWHYKFNLYEAAGVREYWVVDPKEEIVTIFLLQPTGKYDMGTEYDRDQKAPVHILKGLEINLNKLFKE